MARRGGGKAGVQIVRAGSRTSGCTRNDSPMSDATRSAFSSAAVSCFVILASAATTCCTACSRLLVRLSSRACDTEAALCVVTAALTWSVASAAQ